MIRSIENVTRGSRVSSEDIREMTDGLYQKHSAGYHKILQLYGLLRTASLGLEMTNSAMSSVISSLVTEDANVLIYDAADTPTYPSSIGAGEKAECHQEFMTIIGKRVNTKLVFTDDDNVIDSAITVRKALSTADNSIPTGVVENAVENALTGDAPYIARYLMDSAVRTTLTLDMKSTAKPMYINALRFIPIPSVGMVTLDNITYGSGSSIILNGGSALPEIEEFSLDRSYQGYIHFRPITTTDFYIALSSETYMSNFEAVAIGLSRLIGEINTYASTSYIGWEVEYPTGYTKINRLRIIPGKYSNGVDNTRVKVYDNVDDFNAVNDSYIELCGSNTSLNISSTSVPTPYILLEIDNDNGTTPCVSQVKLEFE